MSLDFLQVAGTQTSLRAPTTSASAFGASVALANGAFVVDTNGNMTSKVSPADGTAATGILSAGTIAVSAGVIRLTTAGAVTGVIVAAGTVSGQKLVLINTSANSITMAAAGTSNVADGTSAVIAALTRMTLYWDVLSARWYHGN